MNMIKGVPLDTPPQAIVMSLAHNHPQISLSRVAEELPLSNLSSKSNSVVEDDRALICWW